MTFPIVNDFIVKILPPSFHLLHFSQSQKSRFSPKETAKYVKQKAKSLSIYVYDGSCVGVSSFCGWQFYDVFSFFRMA
mgnify:CR=1 FL=1